MFEVEHRPVYGSKETDEFICSCGWRGPTTAVVEHYDNVASEARVSVETFVTLVEDRCAGDDWKELDNLEGDAGYLSPLQFVIAARNQGFKRNEV